MILEVIIRGFRGVPDERTFRLGRLTFLSGRNGLGKTTFFDAIDWCLFGSVSRLGDLPDTLRNLYADSSSPSVELRLSVNSGEHTIRRTPTRVMLDGSVIQDRQLLDAFITDRTVFPPHSQDVPARVRALVYLEQAAIRSLVSASDEEVRTELFQALLGIPHVSSVRASIRKVTTDVDGRIKRVEQQLEQIDSELQDPLVSFAQDQASEIERMRRAIQTSAPSVLSITPAPSSLSELRSACDRALDSLYAQRAGLEEAGAQVEVLERRKRTLTQELADLRAHITRLEGSLAEADERRTRERTQREHAERLLTEARGRRETLTAEVNRLRSLASRRQTVARLQADLGERRSLHLELSGELQNLSNQLATVTAQSAAYPQRIAALRSRHDAIVVRQVRARRLEELETTRTALAAEVATERSVLERQQTTLQALTNRLDLARTQQQTTQAAYEDAIVGLDERERVAALTLELRRLVASLRLPECPTCGVDYGSPEAVLRHIDATHHKQTALVRGASDAKRRADDAQTAADNAAATIRDAESRVAAVQARLNQLSARLVEVEGEVQGLRETDAGDGQEASDVATALAEAEAKVSEALRTRTALESRLSALQVRIAETSTSISALETSLHEAQEALDIAAVPAGRTVDLLQQELTDAERDVTALEAQLQETSLAERRGHDIYSDFSVKLASATESMHRLEIRLHTAATDLISTLNNVVGPDGDPQNIAQLVAQILAKEKSVKALAAQLKDLAAMEAQNEAQVRLRGLRQNREQMTKELDALKRAGHRFGIVTTTLLARANSEELAALAQQQSAIQECLRALLPHKHLDEVTIDPQSGAVLLTDYLLLRQSRHVKAYHYLSTGQANALAVSMFVGIALRQRITRFDFLLMDEPIQNLDDLHFLAFMSLAKRVALDKQVIFSTADANTAEIFRRQIKSSWRRRLDDYAEYEWTDFSPLQGPTIVPHVA